MRRLFKITLTLFFITIIVFGFALPVNMAGNWYQQFFPNLGGQQINDIIFLDSLTGYAVSSRNVNPDTASILKTTNRGDNWQVVFTASPKRFSRIQFINQNTGFVCGGSGGGTPQLYKTTNAGVNWFTIYTPITDFWNDMSVLNHDTIWLVDDDFAFGGVFRTTNGGINWSGQQLSNGNPDKIYMYDQDTGFASTSLSTALYKTTNSGINWNRILGETGFRDINFVNSQTGWKASGVIKKTTNGGLNWVQQIVPTCGIILSNNVNKISVLNKDTLWAVGAEAFYGSGQFRGIIYRTTNGGNTWLFQVPDTGIHLDTYTQIQFINAKTGWAYRHEGGVHTTAGGDTMWLTPVTQSSNEIPVRFKLYQNYPNPFNPVTNIKFSISKTSTVEIRIFDTVGRQIQILINDKFSPGTYETDFNAAGFSSGVYFYALIINGLLFGVKKMILIK